MACSASDWGEIGNDELDLSSVHSLFEKSNEMTHRIIFISKDVSIQLPSAFIDSTIGAIVITDSDDKNSFTAYTRYQLPPPFFVHFHIYSVHGSLAKFNSIRADGILRDRKFDVPPLHIFTVEELVRLPVHAVNDLSFSIDTDTSKFFWQMWHIW